MSALGTFFVGLGALGIFIPLLPTTPFLLLAAACFLRGSDRMYAWLINNKYLGPFIINYREQRGISLKLKGLTIFILWGTILYSVFEVANLLWLKIILIVIAIGVTIHLIAIRTLR
ncbi:MAG: YbaN family protein [Candidatus Kapaibacterium sp.]